jgi:hypothetical protein
MPGELITADWQNQLDDWLSGDGTSWLNVEPGWSDPTGGVVVSQEVAAYEGGVAVGRDTDGPIVFTASLSTGGALLSPGEAMDALVDLRDVWRASGVDDKELWMRLPNIGNCYLVGRPRAPEVSLADAPRGVITVMVTFVGVDGVLYEGS